MSIEESLNRIAVALEAIAAKPPVLIMTAPAAGGGQSLVGVETGEAAPAAATGKPRGRPPKVAVDPALAKANAAIDAEAAAKAAALAAMPPLPGKPIEVAADEDELVADEPAETLPTDADLKQAVVALISNSKRAQAVAILKKYGCANASAVPDEHRVVALAELQAALKAA